jgi:hypothetical protein
MFLVFVHYRISAEWDLTLNVIEIPLTKGRENKRGKLGAASTHCLGSFVTHWRRRTLENDVHNIFK